MAMFNKLRHRFSSPLLKKNYNLPDLLNVHSRSFRVCCEIYVMEAKSYQRIKHTTIR
jgi:hypothetical protein